MSPVKAWDDFPGMLRAQKFVGALTKVRYVFDFL